MKLSVYLAAALCFSLVAPCSASGNPAAVGGNLPVFALMAQTPTASPLVQLYNDNVPALNQLVKTLRFQEAVDRAKALLPPVLPVFDAKDPASIQRSLEEANGAVALHNLYGNMLLANGQWEEAVDAFGKGVAYAGQVRSDLDKTFSSHEEQWKKTLSEGQEYIAKHEGRVPLLEAEIAKVQLDIKNHNEKKVRLDKKQLEELQSVRIPKAQKNELELAEIKSRVAAYKDSAVRYEKVKVWMAEQGRLAAEIPQAAEKKRQETSASLAKQSQEIAAFNAEESRKKKGVRMEGPRHWVEAVLNKPSNVLELGDACNQAQFLRRLLVLSPQSKAAGKALQNLNEGRSAFAAEPKLPRKQRK